MSIELTTDSNIHFTIATDEAEKLYSNNYPQIIDVNTENNHVYSVRITTSTQVETRDCSDQTAIDIVRAIANYLMRETINPS